MKKILMFVFLSVCILNGSIKAQNDGWVNLFNGKDFTGWKQLNGEAKYEVIDGVIVGTTVLNTPNSFLCTEKNYSDFVFEVDLLVEENMNSGIQFRSESKAEYNNGLVHGYQCEVDPSARAWSAGIYDEARRGWLYPLDLNPDAKSALKMNEWNHYRIECIGNSIKTWLNGVACAHVIDNMTPEGFIALQVHGIGNNKDREGQQIKWKNIRIKTENLKPSPSEGIYVVNLVPNNLSDAEKEQGFKLLFDGKSTDAWKSARTGEFPANGWEVKDGVLSVLSREQSKERGGDIITKDGSLYVGDFIDYNSKEIKERTISEVIHRFGLQSNPNGEGYYYKPFKKLDIRRYSDIIETAEAGEIVIDIPGNYVTYPDGSYSWRDLLTIGYFEEGVNGVDYPFVNGSHYFYFNHNLYVRRQTPPTLINQDGVRIITSFREEC